MKLEKDDFNELCKNFTIKMSGDFDTLAKMGFTDVGSLVHYLEDYKK